MIKEDIRDLIYREILEYHPQLLKDYLNGTEGTSFMYPRLNLHLNSFITAVSNRYFCFHVIIPNIFINCSAIGQFRKQFAYLEENGGKSGPVIPPERKHVSLPR